MLAEDGLHNAVVLVMANKQDLPRAVPAHKVIDGLSLRSLRHAWYLQPCSAISGDGVYEGLEWLHQALRKRRQQRAASAA